MTFVTGRMLLRPGVAEIDKRTPTNPDGYQRDPSEKRFKKIAEFLKGGSGIEGILPQSVLLGLRGEGRFQPIEGGDPKGDLKGTPTEFGTLTIPGELLPLREDDGQHRIGGLRKAAEADPKFLDYPLPAVIMEGSTLLHEATLFYVVNTESVKVPTDLAQRLIAQQVNDPKLRKLLIETGKDWVARATQVTDILNTTEDQPWYDYIVVPNSGNSKGIRQNTLIRSLRPLLTGDHVYKNQSSSTMSELLIRYWRAMGEVWPAATDEESRERYSLMKSVGVLTMHGLAPTILEAARTSAGRVTQEAIVSVLKPVAKELHPNFWHSKEGQAGKVGTNNKAVRYLTSLISEHLRPSEFSSAIL